MISILRKANLFFYFLFFFSLVPVFAEPKELSISAERVSYEKTKNLIEAETSVEVTHKDFIFLGNHLIYNTSAETIYADCGFEFRYLGLTIEGETLDYQVKEAMGTATNVRFLYHGVRLGGGRISFTPEKFEIKNASFTTCSLPNPHYRVTALDLSLYPNFGWMVAYWGWFWLWQIPVVPMPTYIYDFRAEERGEKNLPPFPVVGSNPEDGSYLTETMAWNILPELSGSYSISYFANKGLGLGLTANYFLDNQNRGNLRLNWNGKDQITGGLLHRLYFGEEKEEKSLRLLPFMQRWRNELELELTSRERINYQKVSFLPGVRLTSRGANYFWEINAARVEEEGNVKLYRGGGKVELSWRPIGDFSPKLGLDANFYSNGARWNKLGVGAGWSKSFDEVVAEVDYWHYFLGEGESPFLYEKYRFRLVDRLAFRLNINGFGFKSSYFLDNWSTEDIDYILFLPLHCYNLELSYRSLRGEFFIGVSLAER